MTLLSVLVGVQMLAIVLLVLDHFALRRNLWKIGVAIIPLLQLYEQQRNQPRGCDHAVDFCLSRGTAGHLGPLPRRAPQEH